MQTVYYFKGKKITHTAFIAKCNAIGVSAGKRSYIEQLKYMSENARNPEKKKQCKNLLKDISLRYE